MPAPEGFTRKGFISQMNSTTGNAFPAKVNFKALSLDADATVTAEITCDDSMLNPAGAIHGGALLTFADTIPAVGFVAAFLADGKIPNFVTTDMSSYFLSAAQEGDVLTGVGRIVRWGKTSVIWDIMISNRATGKDVLKATASFKIGEPCDLGALAALEE